MTKTELKALIIQRISGISDIPFLRALNTILDSGSGTGMIRVTPDQLDDIKQSRKEIKNGIFIEDSIFGKEVKQWLKAR